LGAVVSCQEEKGYDCSSLRYAYSAAAPLPATLEEKTKRIFESLKLYVFYGSTELGEAASLSPTRKRDFPDIPCIGGGSICGDIRILRQDATDIAQSSDPDGEVGEIAVRGPTILSQYYRNPEATKEAFTEDSYLLTGDLGRMDSLRNVYITGRSKEMIISGGENVYPAETENVLFKHPAVEDTTVIGVPHKKWGETPRAIVVLKPGGEATEEELITFCKSNLAGYKCPTSIVFVDSIPRSSAGKVQKHKLKEAFGK